jgi:hypothetical protein
VNLLHGFANGVVATMRVQSSIFPGGRRECHLDWRQSRGAPG